MAAAAETGGENGGRSPFHKFISAVNCVQEKCEHHVHIRTRGKDYEE